MTDRKAFFLLFLLTLIPVQLDLADLSLSGRASAEESKIAPLPHQAEILFVSNRSTNSRRAEIYSMDADGKNQQRLTFTNMHHFLVGIDRSRRYIAASRAVQDNTSPSGLGDEDRKSLWIIDLKNGTEKRLTPVKNHAEGDSFSPDGKWIVFMMKVEGEDQHDLYKIRVSGSGLTRLTNTKTAVEGDPAWSPDGKEIVFTYLDGKTRRFVLKRMDSDGRNQKVVYDGGKGVSVGPFPPGNFDPSWSADGKWIVFERAIKDTGGNWGSGIWHIFKVRRDGRELVDLSVKGRHSTEAEYLPSFSRDNRSIIYGSMYEAENHRSGHSDIFIMDANTGIRKRLTTNPGADMFPVWIWK